MSFLVIGLTQLSSLRRVCGLKPIARKANKDKRAEKRLHALELIAGWKHAKEAAAKVDFKERYIPQLTAKYVAGGIEAIAGNHYGGNRRNISAEKEAEFIVL